MSANKRKSYGKNNDITPEQRALIEAYMECRSIVGAFRAVHPDCDNDGCTTPVYVRASRAFKDKMRREIDRLDRLKETAEKKEADRAAKEAAKKWSKADSIDSLVSIVRTCQNEMDYDTANGGGVNTKLADTIRGTIDTLNKMLGYNEPDKQEIDNTIRVVFGRGQHSDDHSDDSDDYDINNDDNNDLLLGDYAE